MRVLHTSDWHIGRRFKGLDLGEYQARALDWLIGLIERERVDVLCVSGDIYDLPRPSASSVQLFAPVFERLAGLKVNGHPLEVIMTPGNHDSADRLGFGAGAMVPNVHMRCRLEDIAAPVMVERDGDALAVYTVPYLDPDASRPILAGMLSAEFGAGKADGCDDDSDACPEGLPGLLWRDGAVVVPRSHEGVMTAAMTLITRDLAERRTRYPDLHAILMAHAFVSGATPSDSERVITVGGVDSVPAGVFTGCGFDYLALGHLHRPQNVTIPQPDGKHMNVFHFGRTPQARYSGSLLAYSFSEAPRSPQVGNGKQVTIVDFGGEEGNHEAGQGTPTIETRAVQSEQPAMVSIAGTLDEVLSQADLHQKDWVSVTVQYDEYPQHLYERIDGKYPFALEKRAVCTRVRNTERAMADLTAVRDEMDVLNGFVEYTIGRTPDERETAILRQVVEQVRAERAEHTGAAQQYGADSDDGCDRGEMDRNTTGDLALFDDDVAGKE